MLEINLPPTFFVGVNALEKFESVFQHIGLEKGKCKLLVITDSGIVRVGLSKNLENVLRDAGVSYEIFSDVTPNPTNDDVEKCLEVYKKHSCNLIVALGGGSVMDVAKAVALRLTNEGPITRYEFPNNPQRATTPIITIPTTAGTGSEVTPFCVIIDKTIPKKVVIYSPSIISRIVILDPSLTLSLPKKLTAETGIDALTHAIESYVSPYANPFSDELALKAIEMIAKNIRIAYKDGENIEAREKMLVASTLAGISFSHAGLGVIHALSHAVSAKFGVSHGLANALLLPVGMEFNLPAATEKFANIAEKFGITVGSKDIVENARKSIDAVKQLLKELDIPNGLSDLGITKDDIDELSKLAFDDAKVCSNPRKIEELSTVKELYEKAMHLY